MPGKLAIIDVETSGTDPAINALLSLAVVPLDGDRKPLSLFICPPHIEWTDYARRNFERSVASWNRHAVPPLQALGALEDYLLTEFGGEVVTPVGHNVGFDLAFIRRLAYQSGHDLAVLSHRAVDTHSILFYLHLKGLIPETALSSDGAFRYFQIRVSDEERHTALGDAIATRELMRCLIQQFDVQQTASRTMRSRAV